MKEINIRTNKALYKNEPLLCSHFKKDMYEP